MDYKNDSLSSVEADVHITRKGRTYPKKLSPCEFDKSSCKFDNLKDSQISLTSEENNNKSDKLKTVYIEKSKKEEFEKVWGNKK